MNKRQYTYKQYREMEKRNEKLRQQMISAYELSQTYIQNLLNANVESDNFAELQAHYNTVLQNTTKAVDNLKLYVLENLPVLIAEQHKLGKYWGILGLQEMGVQTNLSHDSFSKIDEYAIRTVILDMQESLELAANGMLNATQFKINKALNESILNNLISGESMQTAYKSLASKLSAQGVTSFKKSNGANMSLVDHAKGALHEGVMKAHNEGTKMLMLEDDFYYVTFSDHKTECSVCHNAVFKGGKRRIYSIHPSINTLPDGTPVLNISEAPNGGAPFHRNCRHVMRPFIIDYEDISQFATEKKEKKED